MPLDAPLDTPLDQQDAQAPADDSGGDSGGGFTIDDLYASTIPGTEVTFGEAMALITVALAGLTTAPGTPTGLARTMDAGVIGITSSAPSEPAPPAIINSTSVNPPNQVIIQSHQG